MQSLDGSAAEPVDEIFRLQRMDEIKAAERKFLR
jgi:hypothetical protein